MRRKRFQKKKKDEKEKSTFNLDDSNCLIISILDGLDFNLYYYSLPTILGVGPGQDFTLFFLRNPPNIWARSLPN